MGTTIYSRGKLSVKVGTEWFNFGTKYTPAEEEVHNPLTITTGGTYSGNWLSTDANVATITVNTTQPVIIENSTVKGKNHLIRVPFGVAANLTVRNVHGIGLNPNVVNKVPGRFVHADTFNNLVIEHNEFEDTAGIYAHNFQGSGSLKIRYNKASNIIGAYSNGAGGWKTGSSDNNFVQFAQLNDVHDIVGADISWNQVINEPGNSRVEDIINIFDSSGTSSSYIDIHDNYLQGSYPISPTTQSHSGSAIMLGDGEGHYQRAKNNQAVNVSNVGIAIAGGANNILDGNRIVSSGKLANGDIIFGANVGMYVWNFAGSANFDNNDAINNTIGYVRFNSGVYTRNDYWVPDVDTFSGTVILPNPIDATDEAAEFTLWQSKVSSAGLTIGREL